MKKRQYAAAALLAALLAVSGSGYILADDLDDQLSDVQSQIESAKAQQISAQATIDEVLGRIKQIQQELDAATAELNRIQNQVNAVNAKIRQTEEELRQAEARLAERQRLLNRRVRAIYMHGQLNYLEVIMGSKSFSDFANRLELLKRIIRADYNLIMEIQEQQRQIAAKKAQLDAEKQELEKVLAQAAQQQKAVAAKKAEQQVVLDSARNAKAAATQMESELQATSDDIRARIQARQAALAAQSSGGGGYAGGTIVTGSGALSWPVSGPITSSFGYRIHPIFGVPIGHAGIDIGVPEGTTVRAADSGTVIEADWLGGYGYAVIIDHGNGLQTVYGHNSSLLVSAGQSVSKGEPIAYSGSTGYSTGPHCHFEVRLNGTPVDPMGYL